MIDISMRSDIQVPVCAVSGQCRSSVLRCAVAVLCVLCCAVLGVGRYNVEDIQLVSKLTKNLLRLLAVPTSARCDQ